MLRQRLKTGGHAPLLPFLALLAIGAAPALAQGSGRGPIQDNSFLLEEAYNQERAVMQTIQTFTRDADTGEWLYTLTQEFPVPGQKHQLSYTLPVLRTEEGNRGVGDLLLNYRYQLVGSGETRVAVAPRVSVVAPTGAWERGLGSGGWGVQLMLPASVVLTEKLVSHTNVGASFGTRVKNGDRRAFVAGQSLVWLARENVNAMVEALYVHGDDSGNDVTISPGLRFAFDFPGGLQVVPGVAVPIGIGPSAGQKGIFLYLSFEHPFRKGTSPS